MDNIDFAVLSKIQELGERFGLKPYDFIATLDHSKDKDTLGMGVSFENMADGDDADARVRNMLKVVGVDANGVLQGGEKKVIDALDHALTIAPKPRSRF